MKKCLNIIFVLLAICMFYGAFVTFSLSGAEKISPRYLSKYLQSKNCEVIDKLDGKRSDEVETYYVTNSETCPYEIIYLIIPDKEKKEKEFDKFETIVKNNPNIIYNESLYYYGSNYVELYTSGDFYRVLVKYKDSLLFIQTDIRLKDEVVNIKKDLGYYIENKNSVVWKFFFEMGLLFVAILFFINSKQFKNNNGVVKVKLGIFEIFHKTK